MSDFLRNLRSSHKKSPSDPKRSMTGHYYPQNDRRKIQDRRSFPDSEPALEQLIDGLVDILPKISDNSSVISSFLESLEVKADLLIDSQIRQQKAVSLFFENLNTMLTEKSSPASDTPVKASASYASGTHYTKDEILDIMQGLRKEGATFAQIADHLTQKGIPTFSGKGHWHAQTIHRLCK